MFPIDGLILTDQTINIEGSTIRSVTPDGPPLAGADAPAAFKELDPDGRFIFAAILPQDGSLFAARFP